MSLPAAERTSQEAVAPATRAQSHRRLNWHELATSEWQTEAYRREFTKQQERTDQAQRLGRLLSAMFGEAVVCDHPEYSRDGLTFGLVKSGREYFVTLRGTCPQCGEQAMSGPVGTLMRVGHMLERFEPGYDHHCPVQTPPQPTTEERLLAVLRDLIDERLDHELSTRGQS